MRLPKGLKSELGNVSNLSEIFELLVCSQFCNWMELDILKRMAMAGGIPEATYIISAFEECIHSKKCCDVILNFRKEYINPDVFEKVTILLNEKAEIMTVAELMKKYREMEAKLLQPTSSKGKV